MKSIILFFVIAAACAQYSYAQERGLLNNGDLEIWKNGKSLPQGWATFHVIDREGIFRKAGESHSGTNAIQADFAPKKAFDNRRFFSSATRLDSGKYKLQFFTKGKGDIRFISLHREGQEASGKNSEGNIVGIPAITQLDNKDWVSYTLIYDVRESGSYQLTICVNEADNLLFDDINFYHQ
ncbi:hypothetical protein [Sphingobacterium chuzhouense]|uniref:Uncharacterized protein n=1 Tax=Sphingobacterium chuzhouense TaxID=1742264 RepID=A0ABR7XNU4_9SPHI|nr:hypothetical protein [Sphingobacterium chuzhouense]MBD1420837.1 hypothetical protein [Sphingobacterium chuzhouense]